MFESLKQGLAAPLSGMGISFSSSLFGLAGSLVLGFLDLQTSQAQNRFYTDLEDWLSTTVRDLGVEPDAHAPTAPVANELRLVVERLKEVATEGGSNRAATNAMANLAEAIQGLVSHMRSEQQMIRDWVNSQSEQQREIRRLLERLRARTRRNSAKRSRATWPLPARRRDRGVDYWPGFVDALSTLILGIIFMLTIFVVVQFFLSQEVTGKDTALARLNAQIAQLDRVPVDGEGRQGDPGGQPCDLAREPRRGAEAERDRLKALAESAGSGAAAARSRIDSVDRATSTPRSGSPGAR